MPSSSARWRWPPGTLEQQATEVRHLQRTEVREAEEPFTAGQKGSSAMPHKRNPILSENLTGLSRLVRSYAVAALEDVALWHERDISHSSVERVIGPDATLALDFGLHRFAGMMEGLRVYPERMLANLELTGGLQEAQRVLLALVGKGLPRQEAYVYVQRNAMKVWEEKVDFRTALERDPDVSRLLTPGGDRRLLRARLPPEARRHDLQARVRGVAESPPLAVRSRSATASGSEAKAARAGRLLLRRTLQVDRALPAKRYRPHRGGSRKIGLQGNVDPLPPSSPAGERAG